MSNLDVEKTVKNKEERKQKKEKKKSSKKDTDTPMADVDNAGPTPTKKDKKRKRDDTEISGAADSGGSIENKKAKKEKKDKKRESNDGVAEAALISAPAIEEQKVKKEKKAKPAATEPSLPSSLSDIAFVDGPGPTNPAPPSGAAAAAAAPPAKKDLETKLEPKAVRKERKRLKKMGIKDPDELDRRIAVAFPPKDSPKVNKGEKDEREKAKRVAKLEAKAMMASRAGVPDAIVQSKAAAKKARREAAKAAAGDEQTGGDEAEVAAETADPETNKEEEEAAEPSIRSKEPLGDPEVPQKQHRFITFVGNLPFTATKDDIAKHFKAVEPAGVRLMTDKATGKSKGYAFVEFDRYDSMKSCLSLYHHSKFDDGTPAGRRINVELTVGGGGAKDERKQKIKVKNDKLRKEQLGRRQRQKDEEDKAKVEAAGGVWRGRDSNQPSEKKDKVKAEGTAGDVKPVVVDATHKVAEAVKTSAKVPAAQEPRDGIHPSRLRQVNRY